MDYAGSYAKRQQKNQKKYIYFENNFDDVFMDDDIADNVDGHVDVDVENNMDVENHIHEHIDEKDRYVDDHGIERECTEQSENVWHFVGNIFVEKQTDDRNDLHRRKQRSFHDRSTPAATEYAAEISRRTHGIKSTKVIYLVTYDL